MRKNEKSYDLIKSNSNYTEKKYFFPSLILRNLQLAGVNSCCQPASDRPGAIRDGKKWQEECGLSVRLSQVAADRHLGTIISRCRRSRLESCICEPFSVLRSLATARGKLPCDNTTPGGFLIYHRLPIKIA